MAGARTLGRLAVLTAAFLGVAVSHAGEVFDAQVRRESDWLVVDLQLANLLDERTRSTVESGLPGSCLLEISLLDDRSDFEVTRRLERSLEVDLWEDVVRMIEAGREILFSSIAEADSAWSDWSSLRLARLPSLTGGRSYHLEVTVHVQPLGAEERERVSRWVSESGRGDRTDVSIDMGGLVRRFFGSGDSGREIDVWRGRSFTLESLEERP
jgi:hypothetical protein